MSGYALLFPELLLLVAVAWAMFAELLPGKDRGAAAAGTMLSAGAAVAAAFMPVQAELFGGLLVFDGAARFVRVGASLLLALWLAWSWARGEGRVREAVALAALTTMGTSLLGSSRELITAVLSLELATIPSYALVGYRRHRGEGLEGALKYFLLSMLTTLVMMYGASFLYGVSGSTRFDDISVAGAGALGLLAVLLTYVGIFAKLSAVPFHFWAPDAYAGAEPWAVAFVSVVPKLGGAILLVRITEVLVGSAPLLAGLVAVGAAGSMLLGNLAALTQTDVRRLMAYSGVAHAGYLMLGAAALSRAGFSAAVFYAVAYSLPSLGIMLIAAGHGASLTDLGGLARRRPAVAWSAVAMLVSLIGIPPLVGFFGKLYLFLAALKAGLNVYVVIAIVMSAVSAGYYLRIVHAIFFAEESEASASAAARFDLGDGIIVAVALLSVAAGIAAGPLFASL